MRVGWEARYWLDRAWMSVVPGARVGAGLSMTTVGGDREWDRGTVGGWREGAAAGCAHTMGDRPARGTLARTGHSYSYTLRSRARTGRRRGERAPAGAGSWRMGLFPVD